MRSGDVALETRLAMAVAQADGKVTPEELELIRKQAQARIRALAHSHHTRLDAALRTLEKQDQGADAVANELVGLSDTDRSELLTHLFDVALADGCFVSEERLLLERIHRMLNTDSQHFDRLLRNALQHKPTRTSDPGLDALFERLRRRRLREKLDELLVPSKG